MKWAKLMKVDEGIWPYSAAFCAAEKISSFKSTDTVGENGEEEKKKSEDLICCLKFEKERCLYSAQLPSLNNNSLPLALGSHHTWQTETLG